MDWEGLLDDATMERLRLARSGVDTARRLELGRLQPGDVGLIEATVASVGQVQSYNRKAGGTGERCRVLLRDATGSAELTLWDRETAALTGALQPGNRVRIAGATVKPAYRGGGVELGLGGATIEPIGSGAAVAIIEGRLLELSDTVPVHEGDAVKLTADARIDTPAGPVRVVAWGLVVLELRRSGLGAVVRVEAVAHPVLERTFIAK